MDKKTIDDYFATLNEQLEKPAKIIITGGIASFLLGGTRPTEDIDFQIESSGEKDLDTKIKQVTKMVDLAAEYSENIDRWSSITYLDFSRHTIPFKKYGKVKVEIMDPLYWSIGKLARYYDSDIQDLVAVLKRNKRDPWKIQKIWYQAMTKSPQSTALSQFKKQVEHFVEDFGKEVWGEKFDVEEWMIRWKKKFKI